MSRRPLELPDFPWDRLAPYGARAREHADGIVDLSVGSPVDETPAVVREALTRATDAHSYPATAGTPELRAAILDWYRVRRGVPDAGAAIPTIGSKELIATLAQHLGVRKNDIVVQPRLAYPTYAIGARLARASVVASDDPASWPEGTALIWINAPGNPDGSLRSVEWMREAVERARSLGAVLVSDECYAEFVWEGEAPSVLDPRVNDGDLTGLLSVYSLSKQSNLAGYRAGFVAGDPALVAELLEVRKQAGLMPPAPVQAAMIAALADERHVAAQRALYAQRRAVLGFALERAGFRIDESHGGLYLWATRGEGCWQTVSALAEIGILVAPGEFYGPDGSQHVRVALTATDAAVTQAALRMGALAPVESAAPTTLET